MQGAHDGVIVSDADGKIVAYNEPIVELIGRNQEELTGQPIARLVSLEKVTSSGGDAASVLSQSRSAPDAAEIIAAPGKTDCASEPIKGPTRDSPSQATIFHRTGMALSMPVSFIPLKDGHNRILGHLTIIYIVQASSVQQAQTEFVSTVSHELRTPLTSIKGFADTILRAGDRLDSSQQRRYISIIKDQADRLTRLVEDLLSVSRLESKKMQLTIRAIDLAESVQRVLRNLADKAAEHRILNSIPAGMPPVWADGDRLEQILTNLIDNAIKYSPPRTTVTITAREIRSDRSMVEFTVSDQGVGIASEHLPEIFSKFSRLDNPLVRQTEGTGLGLYITRSLVIALGGEIAVASSPGNTSFTVRLPAATLEEQAARGRD
jgi:two-component system phosphate regulon sensor histidine kinase PhoR